MVDLLKEGMPVILPVLLIIAGEAGFLRTLKKMDGKLQVFEIGVLYSAIVLVYAIVPCFTFLAGGLTYSPLSDGRLFADQPSPRNEAPIYWYYLLFLACFALTYCASRGRPKRKSLKVSTPEGSTVWILLACYLAIRIFFVYTRFHYNIEDPESYGESYLLYKGLPLILQQMLNHLGGLALTLQLLLMAFMTFNYRKYRSIILCWIALEFAGSVLFGIGSRSMLFTLMLSFLITYHVAVKRISMRAIAVVSFLGLFLFLSLGIIRDLSTSLPDAEFSLLTSGDEFESVFANAYDLRQLKEAGETKEIFPRLYFADLMNLIPAQLSPFRKLDLAEWYVETFYPSLADKGGGLAFGVISEAIVGLGWFDVLWRGAVLGWMFAQIHKICFVGSQSFWSYGFYLWTTVLSYNTFRTSTFALLPRAFYQFAILFFVVRISSSLLVVKRASDRAMTPV